MNDVFSKTERSRIMSLIRSKDTEAERILCKLISSTLYPQGYRYRKNYESITGKPDIAFVSHKLAVFADGDFWHGYNLTRLHQVPSRKYWIRKIKNNVLRDKKVNTQLRQMGWTVPSILGT
jgi:DNA mismatch endonuclease (patch repair protein)